MSDQVWPTLASEDGRRSFSCFPAAILGFIFNDASEVLLLSHPSRRGAWEVVNGAVEAGESPVDALVREAAEEAGTDLRIRPVACVHAFLFRYDAVVTSMLSIAYAAHYLGGNVVPGSDMASSAFRWASLSDIESGDIRVVVPAQAWLFRRAATVFAVFKEADVELEPWASLTSAEVSGQLRSIVDETGP
jgi:8-oxo-dGTP pyrophosphatase MutT (NUDIX family)